MNKKEFDFVKHVYKEVVEKQILDTHKLRKAANIIMGKPEDELIAVNKARQIIYSFWNYHRKQFLKEFEEVLTMDIGDEDKYRDETESSAPEVDPPLEEQSHDEEVGYKGIALSEEEQELAHLASELNNLEDNQENKKERTVLKRKITMLRKKL